MFDSILSTITMFSEENISIERKNVLKPFIEYLQSKIDKNESIRLNFICTHNSRRSHLSQIWAKTMVHHFNLGSIECYSGGTEATAMFPKVGETLVELGFQIEAFSKIPNPIYNVKYDRNESGIICFSKVYDSSFNPSYNFIAIMTCNNADENCPIIAGAEVRFPVKYTDPKAFDGSDQMNQKYRESTLEIGQEMWYVFSKISK
jgi:arsenate reductase (thioredoxin)